MFSTGKKVQIVVLFQDEVLLLKTSKERGCFWQNITGHIEEIDNNNLKVAARREIEEELSINIKPEELKYLNLKFNFIDSRKKNIEEFVFSLTLKEKPNIKLSGEHSEYKWYKQSEIKDCNYAFKSNFIAFKEAIQNA